MENNQQQYREKKYKTQLPAEFGMAKIPPQAPELEEAVLGALMLEKDALSEVVDILKPDMFYKEAHQNIFKSIQSLFEKSQPVDILTVTEELRLKGELEMVGGAYFVTQMTNKVASAANIEFHARIIAQKYIQRELIRLSGEIIKDAYEDTTDVFDLLDKSEQALFSITEGNLRRSYAGMSELIKKSVEQIEALKDKTDGLTGVPTGFSEFDRETSGWQKSDLVIVAARPGMGKTAFVISMARNAAVDFGQAVAIFSLEMSAVQLVNRLISAEAELPSEKLKKGNLEDHEWEQLHHKIGKLSDAPLFIDDTPALSIFELRAKCRRLKSQHDIQLIIIDYLQLMNGSTDNKQGNREQEIGNISRAMKSLAKELEVPVIALSQLNRSVETRGGDKKPMLSDLRESGSIEQDADMVLFIYRPEYYDILEDENGNSTKDVAEVIIAKHRNGSLKTIPLKFIGKYIKFTDLDPSYDGMGGALLTGNEMMTPDNPSFITRKSKMDDDDIVPF